MKKLLILALFLITNIIYGQFSSEDEFTIIGDIGWVIAGAGVVSGGAGYMVVYPLEIFWSDDGEDISWNMMKYGFTAFVVGGAIIGIDGLIFYPIFSRIKKKNYSNYAPSSALPNSLH